MFIKRINTSFVVLAFAAVFSTASSTVLANGRGNHEPKWDSLNLDEAHGRNPNDPQLRFLEELLGLWGIFKNDAGWARSFSTAGPIDTSPRNAFFKPFGNGRSCGSCHVQKEGFSITPEGVQKRFQQTQGLDPIFRTNDGSNSPNAPVATLAQRRAAYSLLLNKGVIRIGMPMPANAEFVLESVNDPYGYASANELSLFRRPLPATNLRFLANVMWDSRENLFDSPITPADPTLCTPAPVLPEGRFCMQPFSAMLKQQANGATTGHAQFAQGLTEAQKQAIVDFQMTLVTAQEYDKSAQFLGDGPAKGGTRELTQQEYYFDINSVFGDPRTGLPPFITKLTAMNLFTPWLDDQSTRNPRVAAARASIARGGIIFNTRTFTMINIAGTRLPTITGATCTNCHSTPNVGSLATPNNFGLGIGDPNWLSSPDLPTYTFRNVNTASPDFGNTITLQDPGQAMITGRWVDMGKFKTPALRGLAMRAPYFHDGSAKTIEATTAFYLRRLVFDTPLNAQEIADLNAFLKAL